MKFGIPCVIILLPLMVFVLYRICRPVKGLRIEVEEQTFVFNWHRIATLIIFLLTAFCWIFGSWISKALGIGGAIDTIIALAAVFLLLYFRVVRWRDIDDGTDWGVLILFGGGLSLSEMLNRTGASSYLARVLSDGIDTWPMVFILIAIIAFVIFSGELASNTASAALLVPIFHSVSSELGFSAASLVIPIALASSCSFMLPVGTPPNAIVFGTGMVRQRDMLRNGIALDLLCLIIIVILALFLPYIL
jgi:sodium-dependent dicarboxylate transporter 2/3/5